MPPLALCSVTDDDHAADVVETAHQLEAGGAFTTRFVHVVPHTFGAAYAMASVAVASGTLATRLGLTAQHRAPAFLAALGVQDGGVEVVAGDPVHELRRRAELGAALLVVGSRRRGVVSSALAGSVSRALIDHGSVPVLVTSAVSHLEDDGPVLCAVAALRPGASRIVRAAAGIARRLERPLMLAAAVDGFDERVLAGASSLGARAGIAQDTEHATALLDRVVAWLDVPRGARAVVRVGTAPDVLVDRAERDGAGLVVVGSRSAGVLGNLLGGSISQELLRRTSRPVVVVPAHCGRRKAVDDAH
jgi:nucleotide-binding universal stress UspA family protein